MNLPSPPISPDAGAPSAIRVFIAEDHGVTLWGLQRLIDSARPCMRLVGTATSRQALLTDIAVTATDVLLLDLDLAGEDSLEVLPELQRRCPGHILVLTGSDDVRRHLAAVEKGARGVVHKSRSAETVLQAIEKVHQGEVWLERGLLGNVLSRLRGEAPEPPEDDLHAAQIASLTPREREIVAAMVHNACAKQMAVAEELHLSEHTLRNHLTSIYSKLGVRGRLALHVYAIEHGLAGADSLRHVS